jgi:hypothetical protein
MKSELPVTVSVRRPNGSIEQVRVGTAVRDGDGFRLTLGDLTIGAAPEPIAARGSGPVAAPPPRAAGGDGMVFPPYGRSKGQPIAGATVQDLEFYAGGCRRTLSDPGKSRWHDKERALLAAIEAELARNGAAPARGGGGGNAHFADDPGPGAFDDGPPPPDDGDLPF